MPKVQPFYVFMQEQRKYLRNPDGSQLSNQQLQKDCGAKWEVMSKEQKAVYRQSKSTRPLEKYTSTGQTISSITLREQNERKYQKDMDTYINRWLNALHSGEGVPKGVFFILSVLNYVQEPAKIVPCEIGIVKASLEKGIIDEFHYIFDASIIPPGYAAVAIEVSKESHRLPILNEETLDIEDFVTRFTNFIQDEGSRAPLYCMWSEYKVIRKSFETLECDEIFDNVLMYSLPILLEGMFRLASLKPTAPFEDILGSCQFDFEPYTGCVRHQFKYVDGVNHCALGKAQRYFYIICSALKIHETYNIQYLSHKHKPGKSGLDSDVGEQASHCSSNWSKIGRKNNAGMREPPTQSKGSTHSTPNRHLKTDDGASYAGLLVVDSSDALNMDNTEDFPALGASAGLNAQMKGLTLKQDRPAGIGRGRKAK